MSRLAVFLISLYQRFVSPYKGFRCAAGAYYGTVSCSQAVKQIIDQEGLVGGRGNIRRQFQRCALASRLIQEDEKKKPRERRRDADSVCWLAELGCWSCAFWQ